MTEALARGRTAGKRSSGRWVWLALPVAVGVVVFLVTSVTQGTCYDSATDPAATYCESGPALGIAGVWVVWGAWVLLTAVCVSRAVRHRR